MIGMLWIAYKRLRGQPWLAMLSVIGIALAVGLAVSVPIFAQAVSRAIMEDELAALEEKLGHSPLAMRLYLLPSSRSPITSQQSLDMAANIAQSYQTNLGIPVKSYQVTIESVGLMLKTEKDGPYGEAGTMLANAKAGFLTNIRDHMKTVSGDPLEDGTSGEYLDVWMHEDWAMELGIVAGDQFILQPILNAQPIKVRIAGTWLPKDPDEDYWPSDPNGNLRMVLLVRPEEYTSRIEPYLGTTPVGSVSWSINLDERHFVPELADRYVKGFKRAEVQVQQWLPDARCDVSPAETLQAFLDRRKPLTLLLFSFSVPIIGFLLYFLTLVANIVIESRRQVTATMVSRGMSPRQLVEASLYESVILVVFGLPLGILVGLGVARIMGHSASFLRFVPRSPLHVTLAGINPWLVLATLLVTLVARLVPAIRQSRWSIIDFIQAAARPPAGSFWTWIYVDILLIVPTVYAYHQLKQQGTIVILGWKSSGDIFKDPMLFLVPVLFMLAASLLLAQIFPLLMRLLDRIISSHLGLVACLTLRQLGRAGRQYMNSLLLIMASLSVGVFMASMAASLDGWLWDRMYYQLGSDIVFQAQNAAAGASTSGAMPGSSPYSTGNAAEWSIPWDKLTAIPGIEGATSVGRYRADVPVNDQRTANAWFLAVDRADFASVAAYRSDFSDQSLGALMNLLATHPDGVLVSRKFLESTSRAVGDTLNLRVSPDGATRIELPVTIVGVYDYFPTVYEEETPAVVGSMDYLLSTAGGIGPFDIWLKADWQQINPETLSTSLTRAMNYVVEYEDVHTLVTEEQEKKERIGVYGTLTIGFLASLALSGIGLLMQYHRSLNERLFRFATLRAIGITAAQVIAQVQLEYLVVLAAGVAGGILVGVEASRLFIPFFRVSTAEGKLPLPPLKLILDEHSIIVMAGIFALVQIAAQTGLIRQAVQARLFQVLRMGNQE